MAEITVGDGDRLVIVTGQRGAVRFDVEVRIVPETPAPTPEAIFKDVIAQMPTNTKATNPADSPGRWAIRRADEVRGITIHHTLSHDPVAVAQYIVREKSLPTTEYTFWVERDGTALLCVPVEQALWHDHTGYPNYNISVGMAGTLHVTAPPTAQIQGAARLCAWLMQEYHIPLAQVQGHKDRYKGTVCPGWDSAGWRATFYSELAAAVRALEGSAGKG